MIRRLAHALVHRYPQPWRERYDAEVHALIDDSPTRLRDLCELFRGLLTERARELVSADDRPGRTAIILVLVHPAFAVVWLGLAMAVGFALRSLAGPMSETAQDVVAWGLVSFVIVMVTMLLVLQFRRRSLPITEPTLPAWAGAVLLPCLLVAVASAAWGDLLGLTRGYDPILPDWTYVLVRAVIYVSIVSELSSSLWPGRRMLQAFGALEFAEQQITSNQRWVEGCHEMIAKGVASPLGEAQAQVEHWTRERDAARERLHALGYRARFRS
jgi:hypothetical protein